MKHTSQHGAHKMSFVIPYLTIYFCCSHNLVKYSPDEGCLRNLFMFSHVITQARTSTGNYSQLTIRCCRDKLFLWYITQPWIWHRWRKWWWVTLTHWPLGEWNEILVILKLILVIDGSNKCYWIAPRWSSLNLTDKSTLVQVMAWRHLAPSHYLNQCWPSRMSLYDVTRPPWVKWLAPGRCSCNIKLVNFKLISRIDILSISCKIALSECRITLLLIISHNWFR